jgi:hypothetical protein
MTTVWIYVDTRYPVGHLDHLKVFATQEAADEWIGKQKPPFPTRPEAVRRLVEKGLRRSDAGR